jgi:hypothetical protein
MCVFGCRCVCTCACSAVCACVCASALACVPCNVQRATCNAQRHFVSATAAPENQYSSKMIISNAEYRNTRSSAHSGRNRAVYSGRKLPELPAAAAAVCCSWRKPPQCRSSSAMRPSRGRRSASAARARSHLCAFALAPIPTSRVPEWRRSPATSAPGPGPSYPHLRRDWAHPRPYLHRDWAHPCPHLRRDWAHPCPHLRRDCARVRGSCRCYVEVLSLPPAAKEARPAAARRLPCPGARVHTHARTHNTDLHTHAYTSIHTRINTRSCTHAVTCAAVCVAAACA